MLFLTDDELTVLTGYKVKPKRLEALARMKIPHELNGRGHIIVRRDYDTNKRPHDQFVAGEVS